MLEGQQIFLSAQKDGEVENPTAEDICRVGTIALIKQVLNLPGDSLRVLVEGRQRAVLKSIVQEDPHWVADVTPIIDETPQDDTTLLALVRTTHELFEEYARASMRISPETLKSVSDVEAPDQLADVIAANVLTRLEDRQAILEEVSVTARLETLCGILMRETELASFPCPMKCARRPSMSWIVWRVWLPVRLKSAGCKHISSGSSICPGASIPPTTLISSVRAVCWMRITTACSR